MKVKITSLLLVLMGLTLISCGGGPKTSTSLEISQAFAMTTPYYGGGLIISGKHLGTGKYFSVGLSNSTSIRYDLDPGAWAFSAVGWDGGANNKIFEGKSFCGHVIKNLGGSSDVVNLSLTEARCADGAFAGSFAGATTPALATVDTCQTLFSSIPEANDSNPVSSKIVNSSTPAGYCTTPSSLPKDLHSKIGSIRIHSQMKAPNDILPEIGIRSECFNISSSYASPSLKLPVKNVPFIITLFEEAGCSRPMVRYDFDQGLEMEHPQFDHVIARSTTPATSFRLFLPSNELKRGFSSLIHLMPFFARTSSPGFYPQFPTVTGQNPIGQFHAFINTFTTVELDDETCDENTPINVTGLSCVDLGDKVAITFKPNTISSSGGNIINEVSFKNGSNKYIIEVEDASNDTKKKFLTNRNIYELLGPGDNRVNEFKNYFGNYANGGNDLYGVLSEIRNMFSPDGAAGLLGLVDKNLSFKQNCLELNSEKSVAIFNYDRMSFETYRVQINSSPINKNLHYICNNEDLDPSSCPLNLFEKKMLVWDYQQDLHNPVMAFEFKCDNLVGSFESTETKGYITNKKIINWNLNLNLSGKYQRFEILSLMNRKDQAGNPTEEIRRMAKVQKADEDFDIRSYKFSSKYNAPNWNEEVEVNEIRSTFSITSYYYKNFGLTSVPYGNIFSNPDSTLNALRSKTPYSSSVSPLPSFSMSAPFPQTISTSSVDFSQDPFPINQGRFFNGSSNLPPKLSSLNDPDFEAQFGTLLSP